MQHTLVASSLGATVLSACNALVDNTLSVSAPLADHVMKSGEIAVIDVKNSREMEDNKLAGDICSNQNHDSNCDPDNLKRPTNTSSKDSCHGMQELEIIGESGKLTLKRSNTQRKRTKEASKDNIHLVDIKENWVMCDTCEKWRLLPFVVEPSSLPNKWFCQMLDWL